MWGAVGVVGGQGSPWNESLQGSGEGATAEAGRAASAQWDELGCRAVWKGTSVHGQVLEHNGHRRSGTSCWLEGNA